MSRVEENITNEYEADEKGGFGIGFLMGVLVTVLLIGAIYGAFRVKVILTQNGMTQTTDTANAPVKAVSEKTMKKLGVIESIIDANYALDPVDQETMENGIYVGFVDSLGDIYSEYFSAEEMKERNSKLKGVYYGIGAYVTYDDEMGYCRLGEIFDDSPALKAGLHEGDFIIKIDGESVQGLDLSEVVSRIKGEKGTEVVLSIIREGMEDTIDITCIRDEVPRQTINYELIEEDNNKLGYIRITEFDAVTVDQFEEAMVTLKGQEMQSLIIDLRNNPGGNLDAVVKICKKILPKGLIVYTEDKRGKRDEYVSDGESELDIPLVLLINGGSASASEIMAGAIKDYGIGTLVGTKTFGKGVVQKYITLSDGSAVKLTTSKYYTPSGENIHGIGIAADEEVKLDYDAYIKDRTDSQLDKAKEILCEKLKEETEKS